MTDAEGGSPSDRRLEVRLSARYATDEDLIADLTRVAGTLVNGTLTRSKYDAIGRYHSSTVVRRIGSWKEACLRAGVGHGRPDLGHSDDVWMRNIYDIWLAIGRQPSYGDMYRESSRFSPEGFAKRYGSWGSSLMRFQEWVDIQDGPDLMPLKETDAVRLGSRSPNLRLRFLVLKRDDFKCVGCGRSPSNEPGLILHVDHIQPFSKGGKTEEKNLQTLCKDCNYGKTNVVDD